MPTKPTKRGGARKGAGRKAGSTTRPYNVTLDEESALVLSECGNGNLSAGIRYAAAVIQAKKKPAI